MINLNRENFSFDPNIIIGQFIPNIAQLPSDVSLPEFFFFYEILKYDFLCLF